MILQVLESWFAFYNDSYHLLCSDLASQMKYLTDADESVDSPQMKRSSKVLSWIETEDLLFEDTGTGLRGVKESKASSEKYL